MSGTKKKSETLGMPYGTAQHRLRKIVLFDLLRRHNENVCFRCSLKIDDIIELSIEHKQPWEGIKAELYWDLENITFSHLRCNVPHKYSNGSEAKRFVGPEGTAWCYKHQQFLPKENFYKTNHRWSGVMGICKEHWNARLR